MLWGTQPHTAPQRFGAPHALSQAPPTQPRGAALTLTMASLVCAMSEMTPSVMMRSTKYWEPSGTAAAELRDSR